MKLQRFVNLLHNEVSRFSDAKVEEADVFVRFMDSTDLHVADVDVKLEDGKCVAYIDVGVERT